MHVVVIGCDGQLGVCLVNSLLLTAWKITSLNRNDLDITDNPKVASVIQKLQPDVIINVAAYTAVDRAEVDTANAISVNHYGVKYLASAAKKINALLIHISTDYVFDGAKQAPYIESDIALPLNIYGKTKRAGECEIIELASKYIIIRTSWLFDECGNNFFTKMVKLLRTVPELNIVDDQIGGPTYVGDLVNLIVTVLYSFQENPFLPSGIYHYSGYPFVSWYEFACTISTALSLQNFSCTIHPISSDHYPSNVIRPLNSCLDSSKVKAVFNLSPSDWQQAIKSIATLKVAI